MKQEKIRETVTNVHEQLKKGGYARSSIRQFKSTTNQLIKYMESKGIEKYTLDIGIQFLKSHYAYDPEKTLAPHDVNAGRIRDLRKLSEYQLHGAIILQRNANRRNIPEEFHEHANSFFEKRRFDGINEKNIGTSRSYLGRFLGYLLTQSVNDISQVTVKHIHGYLRYITGFSNQSKDHMMRTVRQFMLFCFNNGYHSKDLSSDTPTVHYERRSRLPSSYSREDVTKLLSCVDRNNPIGKRDYAILLLISRLGLRSGDVCNLKFENINWEENRISITQGKTGQPLTLPLLEDVGLAIIDYLQFGRPNCDYQNVFVKHSTPISPCSTGGVYMLVASKIGKAGLLTTEKKRGPHALRHSLASRLLEKNVPLPVISEILGHTNSNITGAYLSIDVDKLRQCALEV